MKINELTYEINRAIFEVNRILGPGFIEKVYENALMVELKERSLNAESQAPINVRYKDKIVGEYIADIIVEDKVIIEIKTVENLAPIHKAQLLNYLKATGLHIGILVNFKSKKAEIDRVVYNLPETHDQPQSYLNSVNKLLRKR